MCYIFIRKQVFKPVCICKLFEERRHRGFPPWGGLWMRRRWWSRSFGFRRNDLWRLQEQVQIYTLRVLRVLLFCCEIKDNNSSYLFILLHFDRFLGCNRLWFDFHRGLWFTDFRCSLFLLQLEKQITTFLQIYLLHF